MGDVSSLTHQDYLEKVRQSLNLALCIRHFPSQRTERHVGPEVELQEHPELLLQPVLVEKSEQEACLIEGSVNSVRVSLRCHQAGELQQRLAKMYTRFCMQRADMLDLLRRQPMPGYDVSFLLTDRHLLELGQPAILDFVCGFIDEVSREVEELEAAIRSQGKAVATEFLRALAF